MSFTGYNRLLSAIAMSEAPNNFSAERMAAGDALGWTRARSGRLSPFGIPASPIRLLQKNLPHSLSEFLTSGETVAIIGHAD